MQGKRLAQLLIFNPQQRGLLAYSYIILHSRTQCKHYLHLHCVFYFIAALSSLLQSVRRAQFLA